MTTSTFDLEKLLPRLMGRAAGAYHARLVEHLTRLGLVLDRAHVVILMNVWHRPGLSQCFFARLAGRNRAFISRAVDCLESDRLLRREIDPDDRRRRRLYLTAAGRRLVTRLLPVWRQVDRQALEGIDPADVDTCREVLTRVRQNLGEDDCDNC
jgi:DNA-binding MarR family transcriptional regulator